MEPSALTSFCGVLSTDSRELFFSSLRRLSALATDPTDREVHGFARRIECNLIVSCVQPKRQRRGVMMEEEEENENMSSSQRKRRDHLGCARLCLKLLLALLSCLKGMLFSFQTREWCQPLEAVSCSLPTNGDTKKEIAPNTESARVLFTVAHFLADCVSFVCKTFTAKGRLLYSCRCCFRIYNCVMCRRSGCRVCFEPRH